MSIGEEIYNALVQHCGGKDKEIALKGITRQSLMNLKAGKANPTLSTIRSLFEINNIPAELVITISKDGKKGKTHIKL